MAIISGALLTRERGDGAHLLFQWDTLSVALMAGLVRALALFPGVWSGGRKE